MNFWERKGAYQSGWIDKSTFEKNMKKFATDLVGGEYIYRDPNGNEKPVVFENVTVTHQLDERVVWVKGHNKQMTYKERQKEIETMMQSATDGQYLVTDGFTTLYGKRLENYTQKEMYDTLKKLTGGMANE